MNIRLLKEMDRGFWDVDMEEDGEDQLYRTQKEWRNIEKGGRKKIFNG